MASIPPEPLSASANISQQTVSLQVVSPSPGVPSPLFFQDIAAATTVKQLKALIRAKLESSPSDDDQRMIHNGRLLSEEMTMLGIFGAEALNTPRSGMNSIHLVLRPAANVPVQSVVPPTARPVPQPINSDLIAAQQMHLQAHMQHVQQLQHYRQITGQHFPPNMMMPPIQQHGGNHLHLQHLAQEEQQRQAQARLLGDAGTQQLAPFVARAGALSVAVEQLRQEVTAQTGDNNAQNGQAFQLRQTRLAAQSAQLQHDLAQAEANITRGTQQVTAGDANPNVLSAQDRSIVERLRNLGALERARLQQLQNTLAAYELRTSHAAREAFTSDESGGIPRPQTTPEHQQRDVSQTLLPTATETAATGSRPNSAGATGRAHFDHPIETTLPLQEQILAQVRAASNNLGTTSQQPQVQGPQFHIPPQAAMHPVWHPMNGFNVASPGQMTVQQQLRPPSTTRTVRQEHFLPNGDRIQVVTQEVTTMLHQGGTPTIAAAQPTQHVAADNRSRSDGQSGTVFNTATPHSTTNLTPVTPRAGDSSVPNVPLHIHAAIPQTGMTGATISAATPVVYILSSPTGPVGLLVHGAESYHTQSLPGPNSQVVSANTGALGLPQNANIQVPVGPNQHVPPAIPLAPQQATRPAGAIAPAVAPAVAAANAAARPAADADGNNIGAHIWLLIRLAGFVWFFLSDNRSWWRWVSVLGMAILVFLHNLGVFNPLVEQYWPPLRQHLENMLPLAPVPARAPPAAPANLAEPIPRGARREEPTPEAFAARLREQRRQQQNQPSWLMSHLRRVEHALLLFVASLVPGVGERRILAHAVQENIAAEAEREEQARRAALNQPNAAAEEVQAAHTQVGVDLEGNDAGTVTGSSTAVEPIAGPGLEHRTGHSQAAGDV